MPFGTPQELGRVLRGYWRPWKCWKTSESISLDQRKSLGDWIAIGDQHNRLEMLEKDNQKRSDSCCLEWILVDFQHCWRGFSKIQFRYPKIPATHQNLPTQLHLSAKWQHIEISLKNYQVRNPLTAVWDGFWPIFDIADVDFRKSSSDFPKFQQPTKICPPNSIWARNGSILKKHIKKHVFWWILLKKHVFLVKLGSAETSSFKVRFN